MVRALDAACMAPWSGGALIVSMSVVRKMPSRMPLRAGWVVAASQLRAPHRAAAALAATASTARWSGLKHALHAPCGLEAAISTDSWVLQSGLAAALRRNPAGRKRPECEV